MIDKAKKHRSHVSSKEAKARGWRNIPRKGTGAKTIKRRYVPISVVWKKGMGKGVTAWANVVLTNETTGEVSSCQQLKNSMTVHNQYNKMKLCSLVLETFAKRVKALRKGSEWKPEHVYEQEPSTVGVSAEVTPEVYRFLRLVVTTRIEVDDAMIEAMRAAAKNGFQPFRDTFNSLAVEKALEGHSL